MNYIASDFIDITSLGFEMLKEWENQIDHVRQEVDQEFYAMYDNPAVPDRVEFFDNTNAGPTVLWTASVMLSSSTGTRPEGESFKFMNVWWKLEPWSSLKINKHSREKYVFDTSSAISFTTIRNRVGVGKDLAKTVMKNLVTAVDECLKLGMTTKQIDEVVQGRVVSLIMQD